MIRELAEELKATLRTPDFGVPFDVVVGPEPTTTVTWGRERIVLEYDPDATDTFEAPRGVHPNPRHRYNAWEACKATLYVQSTGSGASVFEHRRRAKKLRDLVLVALELAAAQRKNRFRPVAGGFVTPAALEGAGPERTPERPGGAVYELRFLVDRAVTNRTWAGAKRPEVVVGPGGVAIATTTKVLLEDADPTNDDSTPGDSPTGT